MKRLVLLLIAAPLVLTSCFQQKNLSSTATAEEEDYFTSGENQTRRGVWTRGMDDFYQQDFVPGTFNQLYNPQFFGTGFGRQSSFGTGVGGFQPGWQLTWHPTFGWHFAWGSGFMPGGMGCNGWGFDPWNSWNGYANWGWGYDPFNNWAWGYDPWFNPYNSFGYNGFGFNMWNGFGQNLSWWSNNYWWQNNNFYTTNNNTYIDNSVIENTGNTGTGGGGNVIPSVALKPINTLPGQDDTGGKVPTVVGNRPETGVDGKTGSGMTEGVGVVRPLQRPVTKVVVEDEEPDYFQPSPSPSPVFQPPGNWSSPSNNTITPGARPVVTPAPQRPSPRVDPPRASPTPRVEPPRASPPPRVEPPRMPAPKPAAPSMPSRKGGR